MKRMAILLMLSGCASSLQAPITQFTEADVNNALTEAKAMNDQAGIECWSALAVIVPGPITGGASTVQRLRDLLAIVNGPCAPIVVATTQIVGQLKSLAAGALVTGSLLPLGGL